MASLFVWGKYTIGTTQEYQVDGGSQSVADAECSYAGLSAYTGNTDYSLNSVNGTFSLTGSNTTLQSQNVYTGGGSSVTMYWYQANISPVDTYTVYQVVYGSYLADIDTQGTFIEEVTSSVNTTYPSYGVQSGYWYTYSREITQLAAPASITYASPVNGVAMSISWAAVSGAASYRLEKSVNGEAWSSVASPTGTTYNYTVTEAAGATIALRVCGYNGMNGLYVTGSTLTVAAASIGGIKASGTWGGAKWGIKVNGHWVAAKIGGKSAGHWEEQ